MIFFQGSDPGLYLIFSRGRFRILVSQNAGLMYISVIYLFLFRFQEQRPAVQPQRQQPAPRPQGYCQYLAYCINLIEQYLDFLRAS